MQGQSVLPNLTVLQNVLLPYTFFRREYDRKKALALLERTELLPLAEQYPSNLSGGEMRRVAIVRALLLSPKLLIADEPTGDLDGKTTQIIMELFESIAREGTAVLMVTHDQSIVGCAGQLLTMTAGKIAKSS